MNEIYKLFDEANLLFLAVPQSKNEPPVLGISFANYDYPLNIYSALHSDYTNKKFDVKVTITGIIAKLDVNESESNGYVFSTSLNYEKADLIEFAEACPPGSSGAFVLGTFHNCEFGVVKPQKANYQPFQIRSLSFDLSALDQSKGE